MGSQGIREARLRREVAAVCREVVRVAESGEYPTTMLTSLFHRATASMLELERAGFSAIRDPNPAIAGAETGTYATLAPDEESTGEAIVGVGVAPGETEVAARLAAIAGRQRAPKRPGREVGHG